MRKRNKLKILEKAAQDFRQVNPITTRGNIEACRVWYRPGESAYYQGMVVGAGSDKLYQGAQRYLVRWDPEKRLPTTEVIDNGVLGRHDVCLMRAIESAVSEVLKYIKEQDTRK